MKIPFAFLFVFTSFFSNLSAQNNNAPNKINNDLITFFTGNWQGDGEFANGKRIAADISFKLSLDSCWLMNDHTDKPPTKYKAHSLWGVDKANGQFVAYIFDNFHGHRQFVSDGWTDGKITLTTNEFTSQRGLLFQHFIYEKLSTDSFKMTFETSKDAVTWKLVDYLIFTRK